MFFEDALKTIRVNGGYMYRLKQPENCYYIHHETKTLRTNFSETIDDIDRYDDVSSGAVFFGSELVYDDWEVDLNGCWKDQ